MRMFAVHRWPFAVMISYSLIATRGSLAQTRIATDFEIAQMQKQVAQSHDFLSQLSGRLNLGDLRAARNENALARTEYATALDIAADERLDARRASALTRYATATSYAALAEAKLGHDGRAFELAEEALRYASDSGKTWNLYASAMSLLGKPAKAASASRNAVAIAERELVQSPSVANRLDLAVYQYALASALIEGGQRGEGERLLTGVVDALRSEAFAGLRHDVVRRESFEIYSSARGESAAYLSLLNRSQLRLGALYEAQGEAGRARQQYEDVLAGRSDDPNALAALARLSRSSDERERYYAEAFDANPFSQELIGRYLSVQHAASSEQRGTTGSQMRGVLNAMQHGELQTARARLEALTRQFPDNDTLRMLRHDIDQQAHSAAPAFLGGKGTTATTTAAELKSLIALFNENRLTPAERAALDRVTLTSTVAFDDATSQPNQTIFERGTIDDVAFTFSEPTAFTGTLPTHTPLRLTYRILGAKGDALLLEPLKLEVPR